MPRSEVPDRLKALEAYVAAPSVVCVRRPILVHDHADESDNVVCFCCGSRNAVIIRRVEFIDVLIELDSGDRSVLQQLKTDEERDEWHAIAAMESTLVIDNPVRCDEKALPGILDDESLVLFCLAGSQGGKTSFAAEILWSRMLLKGGPGATFVWAAPRLQDTQICCEKMCRGIRGDRWVAPIIPPELLEYVPKTHLVADQHVRIRDGTKVSLRFASADGDNLKGIVALDAVFDEATASAHEINYSILLARMSTTGGGMIVSSTPKDPQHWLRPLSEAAPTYDEARVMDDPPAMRRLTLSRMNNPWVKLSDTKRHIAVSGGEKSPRVQREIFGKWTAEGELKWTHFQHDLHTVDWAHRDVSRYGWTDITHVVARGMFRGKSASKRVTEMGGLDFNGSRYNPFSCMVGKIIHRTDADGRDPANWVLYFVDCVVKTAKSTAEFAHFLGEKAGAWNGRGLKPDHYAGLHGVADGTCFYDKTRDRSPRATADSKAMKEAGFVLRPPALTEKGKAKNPPYKVREAFFNELLRTNRVLINSITCVEFVDSMETEVAGKKQSNTVADRLSGPTDGGGYLAYCALYHRSKPVPAGARITASGWD